MSASGATPAPSASVPTMPGSSMGRGMLLLTVANLAYVGSGYALTVWLARTLGPAAYATYGLATAVITVIQLLVARGVPVAATADAAARPDHAGSILAAAARGTAVAALAVGTGAALLALPLARLFGDPPSLAVALLLGAVGAVTYGVHALLLAAVNARQRFGRQALAQWVYAAARLVTVIGGAAAGGVRGAVAGFVAAPLIAAVALVTRSDDRAAPAPLSAHARDGEASSSTKEVAWRVPSARAYLVRSVPLVVAAAGIALLLTIDLFALAGVVGSEPLGRHLVGTYTAAGTIAHVPFFLLGSAPLVLLPSIASRHGDGRAAQRHALRTGMVTTWALLAWPTVALVLAGDALLPILFGSDYQTRQTIVAPLAIATAGITLHASWVAVDTALGHLRHAVMLGVGSLGAMAIGAGVAASAAGTSGAGTGAASAAGTAGVLLAVAHYGGVRRRVGGSFIPWRQVGAVTLVSVVLAVPAWLLRAHDTEVLAVLVLGSFAYLAVTLRAGWIKLR